MILFLFKLLAWYLIRYIVQTIVVVATEVLKEKEISTVISNMNVVCRKNSYVYSVLNDLHRNKAFRNIIFSSIKRLLHHNENALFIFFTSLSICTQSIPIGCLYFDEDSENIWLPFLVIYSCRCTFCVYAHCVYEVLSHLIVFYPIAISWIAVYL